MTEKQLKLVITFQDTKSAMAMEKACKGEGVQGRLIPVPLEISGACGLAWLAEMEDRHELENLIETCGIQIDKITEIAL